MKKILTFIGLMAFCFSAQASHVAAAEVYYEHVTANDYIIHLRIYRDCTGVGLGTTQSVAVKSANASVNTTATLTQTSAQNLYTCTPNTCTNPTSPITGYMVHEYSGTYTLPSAQSDWIFSYSNCCRNPNGNVPSSGIYVHTTLDNLNTPFNNGPQSPYAPTLYYGVNISNTVSFAVLETDGDSLDYRLVPVLDNGTPLTYTAPHTPTNPFPNSALSLNAQTGDFTFTPTTIGQYFIGVEIREYRNGVQISSTLRDMQFSFIFISGSNAQPDLSGVNNTLATTISVNACGAAVMNFTINSTDANPLDSTSILPLTVPTGATFTTNTAQNQIGTFSWPVTTADVRAQPYILVLEVRDNNCGVQHKVYQLYVNNCNTDSVWAGDANADFTCNNYDILNIGIANNVTGPLRIGATTNWQAEWCANWTNNFISNINQKHADCNGDGVVNSSDLAAVAANYNLVHTKTNKIGSYKTLGLPDLYCDMTNVLAHKGSTVSIPVMLGTSSSLVNDFYGISATVELLNAQTSAPIGVSKNVSWIGNASNSFSFDRNLAANKSAFTFVRNNQTNLNGQHGQIGEISFPIDASSVTGSKVIVQFSDIKMIKNNGEEIFDYNVIQDTTTILQPNSVSEFDKNNTVNIYPNPTKSTVTINVKTDKLQEYKMALYDMVGRIVDANVYSGNLTAVEHTIPLDLSNRAQGEYLLEIRTELGKKIIPIQKW